MSKCLINTISGAHKVEVLDDECEECGTKLLECEFLSGKEPKALNGASKHSGCIFCDDIFSKLVSVKRATKAKNVKQATRSKRGRGGRGRGRGRGGKVPQDKMSRLANYFV